MFSILLRESTHVNTIYYINKVLLWILFYDFSLFPIELIKPHQSALCGFGAWLFPLTYIWVEKNPIKKELE